MRGGARWLDYSWFISHSVMQCLEYCSQPHHVAVPISMVSFHALAAVVASYGVFQAHGLVDRMKRSVAI